MSMPALNGDWNALGSAEAMAPHRAASRNAAKVSALVHTVMRIGQLGLRTDFGARLGLPEDAERRRAALVVNRHQFDEVVARQPIRTQRIQWAR